MISRKIALLALILLAIPNLHGADKDKEQKKSAAQQKADREYFAKIKKELAAGCARFDAWHQKQPIRTVATPSWDTKNRWKLLKDLAKEEQTAVAQAFGKVQEQTPCLRVDIRLQAAEPNLGRAAKLPNELYLPLPVLRYAQKENRREVLKTDTMWLAVSQEAFVEIYTREQLRGRFEKELSKIIDNLTTLTQKKRTLELQIEGIEEEPKKPETIDNAKLQGEIQALIDYTEVENQLLIEMGKIAKTITRHKLLLKQYALDQEEAQEDMSTDKKDDKQS